MDSARGPHGGYRLGRGTRLPLVTFTQAEALGLVMTVLDGQPAAAGTGTGDPVGAALGKLIRALPENAPEVDPWAVVIRYGRWYLLCHSHHANAIRTYRVDRVRSVQQTTRTELADRHSRR